LSAGRTKDVWGAKGKREKRLNGREGKHGIRLIGENTTGNHEGFLWGEDWEGGPKGRMKPKSDSQAYSKHNVLRNKKTALF